MKLHLDQSLFQEAITATSQHLNIPEHHVEKDYWVTTVLRNLSLSPEIIDEVVFKGGTSLSKVFGIINRFSEDIDFAVVNYQGLRKKRKLKLLKTIEAALGQSLTYLPAHIKENKQSDIRKTIYSYPDILERPATFVKSQIEIEISVLTRPHPHQLQRVDSYVAQFLKTENSDMLEKYDMSDFRINVLDLHRTYLEKILALARHSNYDIQRLLDRVRHFYDIHMITSRYGLDNLLSQEHTDIIASIREDDRSHSTFKKDTEYHQSKLCESPLFTKWSELWSQVSKRYNSELSELCWTETIPADDELIATFSQIGDQLRNLEL